MMGCFRQFSLRKKTYNERAWYHPEAGFLYWKLFPIYEKGRNQLRTSFHLSLPSDCANHSVSCPILQPPSHPTIMRWKCLSTLQLRAKVIPYFLRLFLSAILVKATGKETSKGEIGINHAIFENELKE